MKKSLIVLVVLCAAVGMAAAQEKGDGALPLLAAFPDGTKPANPPDPDGISDSFLTIDVTGNESWDPQGDPDNQILQEILGEGSEMSGVGWDLTLSTVGASWLSEAVAYFDGSDQDLMGLFLTVGVGDDETGTETYSSGGIVDLTDNGIPNIPILADGTLYIELYESFDDNPDAVDANYLDGVYDIAFIAGEPLPTLPAAGAVLLAVVLLGFGALLLRKGSQAVDVGSS